MSKVIIEYFDEDYKGIAFSGNKYGICIGVKTTTIGFLWWKEVEVEYVWVVVAAKIYVDHLHLDHCDTYFWSVNRTFPYKDKDKARAYLEDLRGNHDE